MIKNWGRQEKRVSRRAFLSGAVAMPLLIADRPLTLSNLSHAPAETSGARSAKLVSPNGSVGVEILLSEPDHLSYKVTLKNKPVIEPSNMGIIVDGVDLGSGVEVGKADAYRLNERYQSRGVHSEAMNACNGAKVSVTHKDSKTVYTIDVRAFDDGVAFRYVVPGEGKQRVPDEASAFTVPSGSSVWYHDFEGHYEGIHARKEISEVHAGDWAAPPLTIKLPGGGGYAAITEGALAGYSGMALQADGQRGFKARLGHAEPVSYPFRLRYGADEGKRLANAATISGTITTPWRVVMIGADLNTLVNCDIINNVSPPPDKNLFPQGINTGWVRPGRAVWKYLDGGESTLEGMKEFSRLAGQLGFEYNVVEGFWQKWTEEQMRELVQYSAQNRVGVWFWKHSKDLRTPESRERFFKLLNDLGVVGAKIDFFDHESKEIVDLYQNLLNEAAKHKIMVDFHGANKPAGESRTWPNEMTREAIKGLEARSMPTRSVHDTTLPFTRMLAGHADYTPVHFGERRRETSWAHQIASAAIFTSPVLIYGAHPKSMLENPAVDLIKSVPSVWDETIALPVSEIGETAAFARRNGNRWFLPIMNGPTAKTIRIALSFLDSGKYKAMLVRDRNEDAAAVNIEQTTLSARDALTVELRDGGGFIARFSK
jgi:alpha-glucosidase